MITVPVVVEYAIAGATIVMPISRRLAADTSATRSHSRMQISADTAGRTTTNIHWASCTAATVNYGITAICATV